ncbi:SLAM family member 9-like, partial [Gymnogyps californianus]|uniref:SLAM family member 9-like n=1 Tax=Gymnogyps californianus TaxID=33616 RepID=UPI0021C951CE
MPMSTSGGGCGQELGGVCWGSPPSRPSPSQPGTAATQPQQVNGVLGRSVLLSPALPPNKTVKEIEWSFSAGAGATIQVAEFGPGGFERPDPKDRFKDRLEMLNETALKIEALERGDSGVYGARIKLHPALVEDRFFNLSVYGPVPAPEIQHRQLSRTAQGCNVTLRCWVPAGSDAEVAWQLGSSRGMPWGQLCEDGRTLSLVVPASAF